MAKLPIINMNTYNWILIHYDRQDSASPFAERYCVFCNSQSLISVILKFPFKWVLQFELYLWKEYDIATFIVIFQFDYFYSKTFEVIDMEIIQSEIFHSYKISTDNIQKFWSWRYYTYIRIESMQIELFSNIHYVSKMDYSLCKRENSHRPIKHWNNRKT